MSSLTCGSGRTSVINNLLIVFTEDKNYKNLRIHKVKRIAITTKKILCINANNFYTDLLNEGCIYARVNCWFCVSI